MSIKSVSVIGSGLMGHGIAQVAAMAGQNVALIDISNAALRGAMAKIKDSLIKMSRKGKLTEDPEKIIKRISTFTDITDGVRNADFIFEAVIEDIGLKQRVFRAVEGNAPRHAIMATNTSGLSINAIADAIDDKENVIGMHWMNPPQLIKVVEIIRSRYTSEKTVQAAVEICAAYQKQTILAQKDIWYFLASRSRSGFCFEANLLYLQKQASVQEIDAVIRYKLGLPMGEFELMDLTGAVDIRTRGLCSAESILTMNPEFEPWPAMLALHRYLAAYLWAPMTIQGRNGVKSGQGFYDYTKKETKSDRVPEKLSEHIDPLEILAPAVNCAAWCVTNGVGSIEDINKTFRLAFNWPKGIFEFVQDYGIGAVKAMLSKKRKAAPDTLKDFYVTDPLLHNWAKQQKAGR